MFTDHPVDSSVCRSCFVANRQPPVQHADKARRFEVSEYGVDFQADPRLILVMAALDAAGFDPVPAGGRRPPFARNCAKDLANLDPDLRGRLKNFLRT